MTTADVASSPTAAVEAVGAVHFLGKEAAYWRLRIKGAALVMVTLGIYRFWLATDVRRFLWSNTEIAGETLEYNGVATELLVGFLFAVAIIAPVYTSIAIAALELGTIAVTSAVLGIVLLVGLGGFALYRARRYRLTRTVFRGLRFDQHGSAWNYAVRALLWWAFIFLTLGFAYPWAEASLQRFKMRNTSYGDLAGRFEGSGTVLLLRGIAMWLLVIVPIIFAIWALCVMVDWDQLSNMTAKEDDPLIAFANAVVHGPAGDTVFAAVAASLAAAALCYPLFQAMVTRWWLSGLRFGDIEVASRLRTARVYLVYLRFLLFIVLYGLLAFGIGLVLLFVVAALLGPTRDTNADEIAATLIMVCFYATVALGVSTIYQVAVTASLWRVTVQSVELSDPPALERVHAAGAPVSALGEGLADALGVGSI